MEGLPRPPITEGELKAPVSKEPCNKAPRKNVISVEIFKVNWDIIKGDLPIIFSRKFLDGRIMQQQKHGI
jgi:hypothetical protein